MEACRWEYRVVVLKIHEAPALEAWLNDFGIGGWEVVTLSTTVKTWMNMTGNDLIAVLKRPSDQPADLDHIPAPVVLAAWHPDPTERHEERFWNGTEWTERVNDSGRESVDPISSAASSPDE